LVAVEAKTWNKNDYKACGGAKKCLGATKLKRLLKKLRLDRWQNEDQLAKVLDTDADVVSLGLRLCIIIYNG
jgi:hypothetical protein